MSSLKMTFSLTSLILIFAFAFGTVSVMAHTADPHNPTNPAANHAHPVVTIVDPADADARTADVIEVVDKDEDTETGVIGTIEFDVMVTLPSAGLDTDVATGQIADTEVTALARNADGVPAGDGTGGAVAVTATADTDDATMVTLALTISTTSTDTDTNVEDEDKRAAAIAALIDAGLFVEIHVNAEAITVDQLIATNPLQGQLNLQSRTLTVQVIAEVDRTAPALTLTAADPASDGSVTVTIASNEALAAAPTVSDTVVNAADATDTTDYSGTYTVSAAMDDGDTTTMNTYTVTVTPNPAVLEMPMIPELTVTLEVTGTDTSENEGTGETDVYVGSAVVYGYY